MPELSARSGVVCCGLTTLDVVHRLPTPVRPGQKMVADSTEVVAGGPAANAAVVAAGLGSATTLVTMIGDDAAAVLAEQELRRHRLTILDCAPPNWGITLASAFVDPAGERTLASTGVLGDVEAPLPEAARSAVAAADVLLLDGHHRRLATHALGLRRDDAVVVLDAGSAKPHAERWLSHVDVLAASADYAEGLGLSADGALRHGLDAGAEVVILTRGADRVLYVTASGSAGEIPVPAIRARDTLGAGDAFHGALAAGVADAGPGWRDTLPAILTRAVAVAVLRVQSAGARSWLAHLNPIRPA